MLRLENVSKSYGDKRVLNNTNISFRSNEFVVILGASGSGKSTLLNIIGALDNKYDGDVYYGNDSLKSLKGSKKDSYRNRVLGFIFQSYNLISHISVLDNVEMALSLSGYSKYKRKRKAKSILDKLGLREHINKKPNQLSGGQMQRVAIARALVNDPVIILADEPTGALDSNNGYEIMNLIKKNSSNKLVIMVTHNEELAHKYATRIIKMKDGCIVDDTNPYSYKYYETKSIKSRSLSFFTALFLSFKNIMTKKGRVFLTSFASSIGIIGISLVLNLASGFNKQINNFEKNTLISLPVSIAEEGILISSDDTTKSKDFIKAKDQKSFSSHRNNISDGLISYIDSIDNSFASGVSYESYTNVKFVKKVNDSIKVLNKSDISFNVIPNMVGNNSGVIENQYDLLAGKISFDKFDVMLVVDNNGYVDKGILELFGISNDTISHNEILNSKVHFVLNNDFYKKRNGYYYEEKDLELLYAKGYKLNLVGILKLKDDYPDYLSSSCILYNREFINFIISNNKDSSIVLDQLNSDINLLSGEKFSSDLEKKQFLSYLGKDVIYHNILIYPKDFSSKGKLLNYLDGYNTDKGDEDKIVYTDQAKLIVSLSSSIMSAIEIVLLFFALISLIVSLIMIGIVMYISVLERTKEIGILRSIGARRKDIFRIFNAETFIIGFISGIFAIFITSVLSYPLNKLLYKFTDIKNIIGINFNVMLVIFGLSIFVAILGGLLPARIAMNKDPIECLKTE